MKSRHWGPPVDGLHISKFGQRKIASWPAFLAMHLFWILPRTRVGKHVEKFRMHWKMLFCLVVVAILKGDIFMESEQNIIYTELLGLTCACWRCTFQHCHASRCHRMSSAVVEARCLCQLHRHCKACIIFRTENSLVFHWGALKWKCYANRCEGMVWGSLSSLDIGEKKNKKKNIGYGS